MTSSVNKGGIFNDNKSNVFSEMRAQKWEKMKSKRKWSIARIGPDNESNFYRNQRVMYNVRILYRAALKDLVIPAILVSTKAFVPAKIKFILAKFKSVPASIKSIYTMC